MKKGQKNNKNNKKRYALVITPFGTRLCSLFTELSGMERGSGCGEKATEGTRRGEQAEHHGRTGGER